MRATEPISWSTAERVASRISGQEPFSSSYLAANLERDFAELTRQAEKLVEAETGLISTGGAARVRVTDRKGWVHANVGSFRRLLAPLTERLAARASKGALSPIGRKITGTQLGVVLGWTSTRVLGQYDLLLFEDDEPEDQDIVYYVGPNVLAMEKRYAFPPREFRLWLALHECTHRAQFTGVPWLTNYFRTQVQTLLSEVEPDPKRLSEAFKKISEEVRSGHNPLADGGLLSVFATPSQKQALNRIYGLMALLEGHGDVTMARAGADIIPNADRFHRVLHDRRSGATGINKVMQRVLGLDSKLRQYEQGEKFIEAVEDCGGPQLMRRVWDSPESLPTYDEIRTPQAWIDRMQLVPA